jgi:hypothetical protein
MSSSDQGLDIKELPWYQDLCDGHLLRLILRDPGFCKEIVDKMSEELLLKLNRKKLFEMVVAHCNNEKIGKKD